MYIYIIGTILLAITVAIWISLPARVNSTCGRSSTSTHNTRSTHSLCIILGSGGHTSELLAAVKRLDLTRALAVHVLIAETDTTSLPSAARAGLDPATHSHIHVHRIPRARAVGQSWLSTLGTAGYALLHAVALMWSLRPAVLLTNGPGTCVPYLYCAWLYNAVGAASTRIIFIESICRVHALSLSGKLALPFADDFLVQWPQLQTAGPGIQCLGPVL